MVVAEGCKSCYWGDTGRGCGGERFLGAVACDMVICENDVGDDVG